MNKYFPEWDDFFTANTLEDLILILELCAICQVWRFTLHVFIYAVMTEVVIDGKTRYQKDFGFGVLVLWRITVKTFDSSCTSWLVPTFMFSCFISMFVQLASSLFPTLESVNRYIFLCFRLVSLLFYRCSLTSFLFPPRLNFSLCWLSSSCIRMLSCNRKDSLKKWTETWRKYFPSVCLLPTAGVILDTVEK